MTSPRPLLAVLSSAAVHVYVAMRLARAPRGLELVVTQAQLMAATGQSARVVAAARRELIAFELIKARRRGQWRFLPGVGLHTPLPAALDVLLGTEPLGDLTAPARQAVAAAWRRLRALPPERWRSAQDTAKQRVFSSKSEIDALRLHLSTRRRGEIDASGALSTGKETTAINNSAKGAHASLFPFSPSRFSSPESFGTPSGSPSARRARAGSPPSTPLARHEEVALLERARRRLGIRCAPMGAYASRITKSMRCRLREGQTAEELLRVVEWAQAEWARGQRFAGLKNLVWLWGRNFQAHLAAAETAGDSRGSLIHRTGDAAAAWQADVETMLEGPGPSA